MDENPTRASWWEILQTINKILESATELWNSLNGRSDPSQGDRAELRSVVDAIQARFQLMEAAAMDQAQTMNQILDQLRGMELRLVETSRRASHALLAGVGALLLAGIAVLLAVQL